MMTDCGNGGRDGLTSRKSASPKHPEYRFRPSGGSRRLMPGGRGYGREDRRCPETAGVEFTNGDRPGLRLSKGQGESELPTPQEGDSSLMPPCGRILATEMRTSPCLSSPAIYAPSSSCSRPSTGTKRSGASLIGETAMTLRPLAPFPHHSRAGVNLSKSRGEVWRRGVMAG